MAYPGATTYPGANTFPAPPPPVIYLFRTPTQEVWFHMAGRGLVGKYDQGLTVYRVAGQWRSRLSPGPDELAAADRYFQGGYLHQLSDADRADLIAGGFADYITHEEVRA